MIAHLKMTEVFLKLTCLLCPDLSDAQLLASLICSNFRPLYAL